MFEVTVLSSGGSAFQALGTATINALSAVRVLILGMTKSPRLVERNRSSVQALHNSPRYAWIDSSTRHSYKVQLWRRDRATLFVN